MSLAFQSEQSIQYEKQSEENLLKTEEYINSLGKIVVPLGVEASSKSIVRDISQIPHILVCGFTGTGKTAFVQTLLSVIFSKHSDKDVKVVIYDSKRVDYLIFQNVPHLLKPITVEKECVIDSLKEMSDELRRRLQLFESSSSSNYASYNELQNNDYDKLPELFIILDDYSSLDLKKDSLSELQNILLNGRIAGIHVILVSAFANTKILNKDLISSIPCRICFRVSSKNESRMILDQSGAEELFVPGEMIFKFQTDYHRCQAVYATYENIEKAMKRVEKNSLIFSALRNEAYMLFLDFDTENPSIPEVPSISEKNYSDEPLQKESLSDADSENDKEPEVKLRDYTDFVIDEMTIGIHDNKICYKKPVMTRLGPGTLSPEFPGKIVSGLIFKEPTVFSKGFMTFEFIPTAGIDLPNPYLLKVDMSNISEVIKIEFNSSQRDDIFDFLQQLSEDLGLPIKYV